MFFVLIFMSLAAFGLYLFPEESSAAILAGSFICVVVLRLILFFTGRAKRASKENKQS